MSDDPDTPTSDPNAAPPTPLGGSGPSAALTDAHYAWIQRLRDYAAQPDFAPSGGGDLASASDVSHDGGDTTAPDPSAAGPEAGNSASDSNGVDNAPPSQAAPAHAQSGGLLDGISEAATAPADATPPPVQPAEVMGAGMVVAGAMPTPQVPPPGLPPSGPILDLPPIQEPFPAGPIAAGGAAAAEAEVGETVIIAAEATAPLDLVPGPGWLIAGGIILTVAIGAGIWYLMKDNKPVRQASPQEVEQAKANQGKPIPTAQDPNTGQPLYTPGDGEYTPAIDPVTGESFKAPGSNQGQAPVEDPPAKDSAEEPNSSEPVQTSDTYSGGASYPVPQRDRVQLDDTGEIVDYVYHADPIPRRQWAAAIDEWDAQHELEHAASELEGSIKTREEWQQKLGETSVSQTGSPRGAAHRVRIEYERDLLRAIQKKQSGS